MKTDVTDGQPTRVLAAFAQQRVAAAKERDKSPHRAELEFRAPGYAGLENRTRAPGTQTAATVTTERERPDHRRVA